MRTGVVAQERARIDRCCAAMELQRYARDAWSPRRGKWLERYPEHSRRYGTHAGQRRPLEDVVARRLPLMRRVKVFDASPRRIADPVDTAPRKP